MDSFYVSVERLKNPSLIGKPVAVGGSGPRAVISSASYEARTFGVRSAMPSMMAKRLCPQLEIIKPSFNDYSRISQDVFSEIKKLAPIFQKVSIDEAYLDLTGCERIYPGRVEFGRQLKERVRELSGLNCSIGIATNKMLAKIASDFCKPNGLFEVPIGKEREFLAELAIEKIPGIGKKTSALLHAQGIFHCRDLASKEDSWVSQYFPDWGFEWRDRARGISHSPVEEGWLRQSLGSEETFLEDIADLSILKKVLRDLAEDLGFELRRENMIARTVQIKMRYPDFTTCTRARTLEHSTDLTSEISKTAIGLLVEHKKRGAPLRLLGLRLSGLSDRDDQVDIPQQMDFFEEPDRDNKKSRLDNAKDILKLRFGKKVFISEVDK